MTEIPENNATAFDYDIIVMGSGPSGQKAAVQAAKLRKRVALVEYERDLGGVCTNTGTIPSKSFRQAVLHLTGFRERSIYGSAYRVKTRITMEDLTFRISNIVAHENQVIEDQLRRNGIEILRGKAEFIDPHTIGVQESDGTVHKKSANYVVIAVGTIPHHPDSFSVDGEKILDSDQVLALKEIPRSITVVGGGIIGLEYASWFAVLGVRVTLIEARPELLSFVDFEIIEALKYHLRDLGMTLRLGEEVERISRRSDDQVETFLKSGKKVVSDVVLVSAGRQGNVATIGLDKTGIVADKYGRISINEHFQTSTPNIYAVGDVIGFPSLASTGMHQGRLATSHAFGINDIDKHVDLPFGIWTIPEIGLVGETERSLTEKSVPYEVGISRYKEIARGLLVGDDTGMLKIIFHRDTHELLGIHIIGDGAIEILHLGQAVLNLKGGLEFFTSGVFNYPTLTECYKVAALDGLNKIRQ